MSIPTFESTSYIPENEVIHIPEQFPINHRSLAEWTQFIANTPLLAAILDLPKPKSVANLTQTDSDDITDVSEDDSDDEQRQEEVDLEMLDSVPANIIDSANHYQTAMEEIHHKNIIDDVSRYVYLLYDSFLIVGSYC